MPYSSRLFISAWDGPITMGAMWNARRLLFLAAASLPCLAVHPRPARAETAVLKTRAGAIVHWTRSEITVSIDTRSASRTVAAEGVDLAIERAIDAWNAVLSGQPRFRFLPKSPADVAIKFCRGRWHGEAIDLGNTEFIAAPATGIVISATVELNECDRWFAAPDEAKANRYDLQAVLTHELGHVLGIGHSNNPTALMYPSQGAAKVHHPQAVDRAALTAIYFGRSPANGSPHLAETLAPEPLVPPNPYQSAVKAAESAPHSKALAIPTDSVSVLSLKTSSGGSLMLYTCEPTLLPPIASEPIPSDKKAKRDRHGR